MPHHTADQQFSYYDIIDDRLEDLTLTELEFLDHCGHTYAELQTFATAAGEQPERWHTVKIWTDTDIELIRERVTTERAELDAAETIPDVNDEFFREINGEMMVAPRGMSLLLGVPLEEYLAEFKRHNRQNWELPAEWVRAGIRRSKEYQAVTGRTDMLGAFEYWAAKESK